MTYERYRNIVTALAVVVTVVIVVGAVTGVWPWTHCAGVAENSTVNVTATAEVGG